MFDSVVLNEASLPFESVEDCENNIDMKINTFRITPF